MSRMTCRSGFVFVAAMSLGLAVTFARGGSLESSAEPTDPASAMYTLENIYDYLTTGVRTNKRTGAFTEPTGGPTNGTMHTLNEIMEAGIIPPKTGQTNFYATGEDGDLELGLAWPDPRFSPVAESGAETNQIRDNLTGLIWARDANIPGGTMPWTNAVEYCATNLNMTAYGGTNDWRLPNIRELYSLIAWQYSGPALCNTEGTGQWTANDPFAGVQWSTSDMYWSSTTRNYYKPYAWFVYLYHGRVYYTDKANARYVWPVRGGQ